MRTSLGFGCRTFPVWLLFVSFVALVSPHLLAQPPVITSAPLTKRVLVGMPVSVSVAATGSGLTYEWKHRGQVVAGASSATFSIPSATMAHGGWYEVAVTGATGTVRSGFMLWVTPVAAEVVGWGAMGVVNESAQATVPTTLGATLDVAGGEQHSVALKADGTVVAWGNGYYGQTTVPAGLSDVVALSAGMRFSLALKSDGTVVAWGAWSSGQGVTVPAGLNQVVAVAAGNSHVLALKTDGTVVAWGDNASGQLDVPIGLGGVVAVACGSNHSVALRADGTVVAWGWNGTLQCVVPAGLTGVTAIAAGDYHTLALKSDGTVIAWGDGGSPGRLIPPDLAAVTGIAACNRYSYAIKADGKIVGWGIANDSVFLTPPGMVGVTKVAAGRNHVLALLVPPALAITQPLVGQTVFATADTTLRVGVTGMPPLIFAWKRDNVALVDGTRIAGATTDKLRVLASDATDAGSYTVTVSDRSGSISSAAAALTVSTAPIPANDAFAAAQVISGVSGTVSGTNVAATREVNEPSHTYYQGPDTVLSTVWYSLVVPQTGAITFSTAGSNFPLVLVVYEGAAVGALSGVASDHTYIFPEGNSIAVASGIARAGSVLRVMVGSQTSSRGLIQLAWQTTPAPINDDFANAQMLMGASGTVTGSNTTATGEPGEPSHSKEGTGTTKSSIWYRWTAPQSGTVVFDTTGSNFSEQIAVYTGSNVNGLTRLVWGNSGGSNYPVRLPLAVTAGTTYAIAAASQYDNRGDLTLSWQLQTAPTIATAPTVQVASVGGTANFSVVGNGGALSYQWYFDGRPITGATNSSLPLTNLQLSQAGRYHVKLTNLAGSATTTPVSLSGPNPAPTITAHPQNATVTAGQPAALSVSATGTGPLIYRWRRNGVVLAGATASNYVLASASRVDADDYDVLVYDGLSVTRSQRASLAVAPQSYPAAITNERARNWAPEIGTTDPVSQLVPDGTGRFFVFGNFSVIGGRWRSALARLNADGSVDPTFTPPVLDGAWNLVLAPAPNGKCWLAGSFTAVDGIYRGPIIRLNPDGSLDSSFSSAALDLGTTFSVFQPLADGRLLVGGNLIRLSVSYRCGIVASSGTQFTALNLPTIDYVHATLALPDGKILVGGGAPYSRAPSGNGLARLNADATLDSTFVPVDVAGENESVDALAVQADGKLLVGGSFDSRNTGGGQRIRRLTSNGQIDPTFTSLAGFRGSPSCLVVQANGKILVAGRSDLYPYNSTTIGLIRVNSDGSLDSAYAARPANHVSSVVETATGTWVVGAFTYIGGGARSIIAKLTADGDLDSVVPAIPHRPGSIWSLAAMPGGATLATGYFSTFGSLTSNGTALLAPDLSVNSGFATTGFEGGVGRAVRQADGRIVLHGYAGIRRVNADGSRDASFVAGVNSQLRYEANGSLLARLTGDRLAVTGYMFSNVVVLNADGSLDTFFKADTSAVGGSPLITAIAGLPDGKMLLSGNFTPSGGQPTPRLIRLGEDGSVDQSFSTGAGFNGVIANIVPQRDGRILLGGSFTTVNGVARKALARLNADGSLDPTFVPTPFSGTVTGLLLQEDGRVIAYGPLGGVDSLPNTQFAARFSATGEVDHTFGLRGMSAAPTSLLISDSGQVLAGSSTEGLVCFLAAAAPAITTQPANVAAEAGVAVSFSVVATGTGSLTYQWSFNGAPIPDAYAATYTIPSAQLANVGVYAVTVSNAFGTVTSQNALLGGVRPPPVVTAQPVSVSSTIGQPVRLSVVASSAGVVTYQWRRDGAAISGATASTLNLGSATFLVAGTYDVVVTDGLVQTISGRAVVQVAPPTYPAVVSAAPNFAPTFESRGGDIGGFFRLANGKVIVAGYFSRINGTSARSVARLNTDGSVDSTFTGSLVSSTVYAVAVQADGKLVIGGVFTQVSGVSRAGLARLNADGTLDPSFAPDADYNGVYTLGVQPDGKVIVGGGFVAGVTRVNIDGTRDSTFPTVAPNGSVNALAVQADGKIVLGGSFTSLAGQARSGLGRLNPDGTLDTTFSVGTGFNNSVFAVRLTSNGGIVLAGAFTAYQGSTANRIIRLLSSGTPDSLFASGNGFNSSVYTLELQADGKILAGGAFGGYGVTSRLAVARLMPDGPIDTTFVPLTFQYAVVAISCLNDGTVLVGGAFSSLGNSAAQYRIARLSANGSSVVAGFGPGLLFPGLVKRVLPVSGGKMLVAGSFSHVNGALRGNLAMLGADGAPDAAFNGGEGADGVVDDMASLPDGSFTIFGSFGTYNGVSQAGRIRLLSSGARDASFPSSSGGNASPTQIVILPDQRVLLLGSSITQYGGVSRAVMVLVKPDGTTDPSFDLGGAPTGGSVMMAAVQSDSKILAAGSFFTIGGTARARLVRLLPSGAIDSTFSPEIDDTVTAVAVQSDGKILIAGDFLVVNSTPRARVARLHPDGTLDATFNPDFLLNDSPLLLRPQADGRVLLAGKFTAVRGDPAASYLIRLRADGRFDSSFSAPGLVAAPSDVAVLDDGSLVIARGEMQLGGVTRIGVVRTVSQPGPVLLASPVGLTAAAGSSVILGASVAGGESATYQWFKAGVPIVGATSAQFSVPGVQVADAGAYTVRISHGGGVIESSPAVVAVTASAPILSPTGATINGFGGAIKAGSRWALTAPTPVLGSTPIIYQWFKNGTLLSGATDRVFSPASWQTTDTGSYQVTLGNSVGSVTTAPFAQMVVTTPDWDWRLPAPQGNALVEAAYLNGRFLLGGVRGTVLSSTDGSSWSLRRLGISNTVVGFAFGASTYVAISSFGVVWSSPDALTWTQRESGVGRDGGTLFSVAFGAGRFVAVGTGGTVVTSTDGAAWTQVSSGSTETLGAVVHGGGRFVALGAGGRTFTSLDGLAWAAGPTLARAMTYLAFGAGRYVAAAGNHVFFSTDAVTWNTRALATTSSIRGLKFTDVGFLATVDSTSSPYWQSSDGIEWVEQSVGQVLLAGANTIAAGGGTMVLGSSGAEVLWVSVGGNWTRVSGFSPVPDFTAAATDGTTVVAVGGSTGGVYFPANSAASSPTTPATILPSMADVTFGAGRFVAVAPAGRTAYSTNGISWVKPAAVVTNDLLGVNFVNGRFIAIGVAGALLTSPDGDTWTTRPSGTTQALRRVAYGAGVYIAVGAVGTVIGSNDSTTWSPRTVSGITSTISDVIFAAGKFVFVSEGGSIRTSTDGATWTAQINPLGAGLRSLVFADGKFYAFTTGNTNYLTSLDGVTWTPAQNGNANSSTDAVVAGDTLFLVGPSASIVSLPLNVAAPLIASAPADRILPVGGTGSLAVAAQGTGPFAYQWFKDGVALIGANFATLQLTNITVADAGSYTVAITNAGGTTASSPAVLTIESRGLITSVARANVGTGPAALTGVFSVEGTTAKQMLIRAVGPALTGIGLSGALVDPQIVIENLATGAVVASNDDWGAATNVAQLTAAAAQAGAMPFASGSKDAAVLTTFAPGSYRVRVVGAGATTGVASLEIYDADSTPRLVYLATRAQVGAGGDVFVQGFSLAAVVPGRTYLIRALGPTLGLPGALVDPQLTVFSGATQLATNDNWGGDSALTTLAAGAGAMALPATSKDSALHFMPSVAGAFTVQVSGVDGATGLVLLEIFEVDAQRAATVPLAVVSTPENVAINAGQATMLGVVGVGKPSPTFQWSRNGIPMVGATNSLLPFPRAQVADAGTYSVLVSNGGVTAFNASATLSVAPSNNATHAFHGGGYAPGGAVTITNSVYFVGAATSLGWSATLPAGWSFLADGDTSAEVKPGIGASGTLNWKWTNLPVSPVTFTYTVAAPVGESVTRSIAASAAVTVGGVAQTITVEPAALQLRPVHSADTDGDGRVGLFELTRVIELYNARVGTTRTGRYQTQIGTEDGFAPDLVSGGGGAIVHSHYHSADTNRDGRVSLVELTRVIELFNTRSGTTRTGAYHLVAGTEDGFAPGP